MLYGILRRGFSSRCKSLIKLTTMRINLIRRKRNATERFLTKDIADLLANGLDINAYGRAEGLLIELTLSSCYLYIELCCQFLLKQLSTMQKVSDCPENCREVISSLIYAAARFSDLPELRNLREALQARYGNSLDHLVNQEFKERMSAKHSTMEKKVKLMQDIALKFSITWDSKAFELRMPRPPSILQEQPKHYGEILGNIFVPEKKKTPDVCLNFMEADDQKFWFSEERSSFKRHKGIHDHPPKAELSGNRHDVLNEEGAGIFRKIENVHRRIQRPDLGVDKLEAVSDCPIDREKDVQPSKAAGRIHGDDATGHGHFSPGPKSVRRKHSKSRPIFDEGEQSDEEERIIDRLLMHYSKKPSAYEPEKLRRKGRSHHGQALKKTDLWKLNPEIQPPLRSISLPQEQTTTAGEIPNKTFTRAATFQPDGSSAPPRHVHPKLPDYDELVALLASLRGS